MKTKSIKEQIKEYFLLNPNSMLRVRQIEKELKLPLPSIIRYVKELEKEGILAKKPVSKVIFYVADKSSEKYVFEKKSLNIKNIYETGLISFLKEKYYPRSIVVFGSYAKGENKEDSDIDLYLEADTLTEINLDEFEKKLKHKIQIFKYRSIAKIENKQLANNILNGIILDGYLEVFK